MFIARSDNNLQLVNSLIFKTVKRREKTCIRSFRQSDGLKPFSSAIETNKKIEISLVAIIM